MSDEEQESSGETPAGESPKRSGLGNPALLAAMAVVIALLLFAIYWFLMLRDTRPDVWEDASTPYETNVCAEEGACEELRLPAAGHGSHGEESATLFVYNPNIDDAIAQWGDCLDQVFTCVQAGTEDDIPDSARAPLVRGCVEEANLCPADCRERFATRTSGQDFAVVEREFFETFVNERGYCVPREADR